MARICVFGICAWASSLLVPLRKAMREASESWMSNGMVPTLFFFANANHGPCRGNRHCRLFIMEKKFLSLAVLALVAGSSLGATVLEDVSNVVSDQATDIVYPLASAPGGIAHCGAGFYYFNGGKLYNMMNREIASGRMFSGLDVSPDGSSYVIVDGGAGKPFSIRRRDLWKPGKDIARRKSTDSVSAIGYSVDSKSIFAALKGSRLVVLDALTLQPSDTLALGGEATAVTASSDGALLAVVEGRDVELVSPSTLSRAKIMNFGTVVRDVAFSPDASRMAVLCDGGKAYVYGVPGFDELKQYDALGDAVACYFHPEGKYLAVVTGDRRIALVNMFNDKDRQYVDSEAAGVDNVWFMPDMDKGIYLVYSTPESIVYHPVFHLSPNRLARLTEELDMRMAEWMEQMPDESLEDYNARINNSDLVMQQMQLFETEIATRMAGEMLGMSELTFGDYNPELGMLAISLGNLPDIYLSVPQDQIGYFMDPASLEFRNSRYYINANDEFELVYTEVYNPANGQTYIFDNTERKSLEYLETDEGFMPLERMQAAVMEEELLEEIKNDVLGREGLSAVSDHTHISVSTAVTRNSGNPDRRGGNYEVNVSYTVDEAYSSKDDFAPGKYALSDSKAAQAMLDIVRQAFSGKFARYFVPGKKLEITVSGSADAIPIRRRIPYNGIYGEFVNTPVNIGGSPSHITVTEAGGIETNEQLAFIRAMGVKDYIARNIPEIDKMDVTYTTDIEVSQKTGAEYRRIGVRFVFVDAFE